MTTVEITLPDQLVRDARQAGLLSSDQFERWLREQLASRRSNALFSAMERMAKIDEPAEMSPEEMAEEISLLRAARTRDNRRG